MVSKELILELQEILKDEFSINLSLSEADDVGNSLVSFFDVLAKISNENKYEQRTGPSIKRFS